MQNKAKIGTKTTLGSRDNGKTAFVSRWDSSVWASLKGEVWGGKRGEKRAPLATIGRGKWPNTLNPLQAGGKAKLPPEEGEYRVLGKGEGAAGDPRMRCNLQNRRAEYATHRSLWSEEVRRTPYTYKGGSTAAALHPPCAPTLNRHQSGRVCLCD